MKPSIYNLLLLKSNKGLSNKSINKILSVHYNVIRNEHLTFNNFFSLLKELPEKKFVLSQKKFDEKCREVNSLCKRVEKGEFKILSLFDKKYPKQLKKIYNPPVIIFYKGNLEFDYERSLAIVGSRRATMYGRSVCKKFVEEFSSYSFTTVSGMAMGIDKYAHEFSLNNGVVCFGVLGCGVNFVYPVTNTKLYSDVLNKGGCILSEYFPDETPRKEYFPARNRIIAGLSRGTLVVEAAKRSGASITAKFAFEEDRYVYAVPGDLNRLSSFGCNNLIKNNIAKLVTSGEDIIKDYGLDGGSKRDQKDVIDLPEDLKKVYELILQERISFQQMQEKLSVDTGLLNTALSLLEVKGLVYRDESGRYQGV